MYISKALGSADSTARQRRLRKHQIRRLGLGIDRKRIPAIDREGGEVLHALQLRLPGHLGEQGNMISVLVNAFLFVKRKKITAVYQQHTKKGAHMPYLTSSM